jgi:hypothetical protein
MFVWTSIAHVALPLGEAGINEIPNESAVLNARTVSCLAMNLIKAAVSEQRRTREDWFVTSSGQRRPAVDREFQSQYSYQCAQFDPK